MKFLVRLIVYSVIAFVLLTLFIPFPLKVAWTLGFGWIAFLGRTVPQVTANWSVIGMSALCSAIILAALHYFCSWLTRARNAGALWRFRSTFALLGIAGALFLTTMGITGIVHQVAWLVSSDEQWAVIARRKWQYLSGLRMRVIEIRGALEQNAWNAEGARRSAWAGSSMNPIYSAEAFHVLFFPPEGKVTNAVVFLRDPEAREKLGQFTVISPKNDATLPLAELERFVPGVRRSMGRQ